MLYYVVLIFVLYVIIVIFMKAIYISKEMENIPTPIEEADVINTRLRRGLSHTW